jgi:hypothetical protein
MGGLGVSGQRHLKDGLFIAKLALEKKEQKYDRWRAGPEGLGLPQRGRDVSLKQLG